MTGLGKKKSSTKTDAASGKSKDSSENKDSQNPPATKDDIVVTEKKEPTAPVKPIIPEQPSDLGRVMSVSNTLETATAAPRCNVMVIDNFYNNPMETREFILTQEFNVRGNYPGVRTKSFASEEIKNMLQDYVGPSGGKIIQIFADEQKHHAILCGFA